MTPTATLLLALTAAAHAAEGGAAPSMEIIPHPLIVLLQMIPFLVTIFALDRIIFRPMLAYLSERDAATSGARDEAGRLQSQIASQLAEYEQQVAAARKDLVALRSERRAEAMKAYNARIDAARRQSEERVQGSLSLLEADRVSARAELQGSAAALADRIAARILQPAGSAEASSSAPM